MEIQTFEELTIKLKEIEKGALSVNYSESMQLKLKEIQKDLAEKRQLLKDINK